MKVNTAKKSTWINKKLLLIVHHTAWWTFDSNVDYLSKNPAQVSCHYVAWYEWEVAQIWTENDILWHRGWWSWKEYKNANLISIWIEVVSGVNWKWFTDKQIEAVAELIKDIATRNNITPDRILRHKDIDKRKIDISFIKI
jgi:N-acetyl-anhydromuramyl-L-alanine amidase AmpD